MPAMRNMTLWLGPLLAVVAAGFISAHYGEDMGVVALVGGSSSLSPFP